MKSIIIGLVTAIVVFAIFYLMASFVEASFDITKWSEDTRVTIGSFCGFLSLSIGILAGRAYQEVNNS